VFLRGTGDRNAGLGIVAPVIPGAMRRGRVGNYRMGAHDTSSRLSMAVPVVTNWEGRAPASEAVSDRSFMGGHRPSVTQESG